MIRTGLHEGRTIRASGLVLVIAVHAAALTALALVKHPEYFTKIFRTTLVNIDPVPDPEPIPPDREPRVEPRPSDQRSVLDRIEPIVDRPFVTPFPSDPIEPTTPFGDRFETILPDLPADPPPARIGPEIDPRFADDLQPPYPASEQRAEREGLVRVRLTIGEDGRVKAVQRLSATSDAFWIATERHARSRWRFRPATLGGRPIESQKEMSVRFRLET